MLLRLFHLYDNDNDNDDNNNNDDDDGSADTRLIPS